MDDVDHDAGMVSINKTWDYKNDSGFMPTKTKSSIREIPLDDDYITFIDHLPRMVDYYLHYPTMRSIKPCVKSLVVKSVSTR